MSDEQNIIIAKWMGWKFDARWECLVPPDHAGPDEMFTPYKVVNDSEENWELSRKPIHENWRGWIKRSGNGRPIIPEFSTDLNAMAHALRVIQEQGLGRQYAHELMIILLGHDDDFSNYLDAWEEVTDGTIFMIANATATQQAEALCRLIAQEKE